MGVVKDNEMLTSGHPLSDDSFFFFTTNFSRDLLMDKNTYHSDAVRLLLLLLLFTTVSKCNLFTSSKEKYVLPTHLLLYCTTLSNPHNDDNDNNNKNSRTMVSC